MAFEFQIHYGMLVDLIERDDLFWIEELSQKLSNETNPQDLVETDEVDEVFKPPPAIFIKNVIDFPALCSALIEEIGFDNFICKSSNDNLKIQTSSPAVYRALVQYLKAEEAEFHTYQLKEDKSLRVVIRNLHPSTTLDLIKDELQIRLFESADWSATNYDTNPLTHKPLPENIRTKIVEKRMARALYQRTRLPSHKHVYNHLANSLKKMLIQIKTKDFESYLINLSPKDGSLWRSTKQTLNYKTQNLPIKKPDGFLASSDLEKAELFKAHLSATFQPLPDVFNANNMNTVETFLNSPLPLTLPVKPFTPNDVKYSLLHYSLKKSLGFDLITAEVVRYLPNRAIIHLTHIFNASLRLSYFPLIWKFSIIIIFPKHKPPDLLTSFRPISLLPLFAKILERLILKRISPIITEKHTLPDTQFSFRTLHSTTHQLHRLVDAISYSLEKKLYCTCAFLDISQAFDRVWHNGLLFKLKSLLPSTYCLIIISYLSNRHFQIRSGSVLSDIASINAGVPQGGILSPILYNIYASDQPDSPFTSVADYADDKVLISINANPLIASENLQNHIYSMENWFTNWRFKVNPNNSIHTTFTLRLAPVPTSPYTEPQSPSHLKSST
ncbi:hypothetical protein QTP88_026534 [Uroleucon formosanum]